MKIEKMEQGTRRLEALEVEGRGQEQAALTRGLNASFGTRMMCPVEQGAINARNTHATSVKSSLWEGGSSATRAI